MTKPLTSCAEYYHEDTKYDRNTIHRFRSLDYSKKPDPFKDYQADNPISLLPFLPFSYIPFSRTPLPPAPPQPSSPWGLAEISRILFFSYGVTAIMDSPKIEKTYMRAAPSAGGLYPAEIYLVTRDLPFLNDGIYHYQSREHHLVPLYEGFFWDKISSYFLHQPVLSDAGFFILVSGMYERSSWRYGERGYRRILLDSGHLLANLSLVGQEAGFLPFPISGFQDKALNSLLFLGDHNEACLSGLAMVHAESSFDPIPSTPFSPSPAHPPYTPPDTPEVGEIFRDFHRLSSIGAEHLPPLSWTDGEEFEPLVLSTSRFTPQREPIPLADQQIDFGDNLTRTLLTRRSARQLSGEPLPFTDLSALLSFGYNLVSESETDPAAPPVFFARDLFSSYLVVHSVDVLMPGLYHFSPTSRELTLLRRGNMSEITCEFSLGQDLGRDASCVLIQVANLPKLVERYGNRIYRTLHMDSGIIGERLNLGAVHMGHGASGIGGFFDDEVAEFLGVPTSSAILYVTVLGTVSRT